MLLLFVLLIAGGALGRYRGSFDSRNLIERDEPFAERREILLDCPVCEDSNDWPAFNEKCLVDREGKLYKRCEYGVYNNTACGNRLDCYRGPGEKCTEKMTIDWYDQRCMPGYYCHPVMQRCTGSGDYIDTNLQHNIRPSLHTKNSRIPGSYLEYPIRSRRSI